MGKKDIIILIAKNKIKRTTYNELHRKLYSVHKGVLF